MVSLKTRLIIEANQKRPSGLGKLKDTSQETEVEYIAGDVYDLSDSNRYTDTFKYYSAEGDGYIYDKQGHAYDVMISQQQGDAGRIAGGSTSYYVTIKNVNGKTIKFDGWIGVFSSSRGTDIISDIKDGMYLEDYIAKHWNDISNYEIRDDAEIKALKDGGNPDAKTYAKNKADNKQQKIEDFYNRFIRFSRCTIHIAGGNLEIYNLDQISGNSRPQNRYSAIPDEEWKKTLDDWQNIENQIKTQLSEALVPIVSQKLKEYFKMDIGDMNGLYATIVTNMENKYKWDNKVALDLKKNQLVVVTSEGGKVVKDATASLDFGPIVTLDKNEASPKIISLFMDAAASWKKLNKKSNWIENNWQSIWNKDKDNSWLYGNNIKNQTQAKKAAAEDYEKNLKSHSWNSSGDKISFSIDYISQFIKNPETIENEVEKIEKEEEKENTRRGQNTVMGKEARAVQEPKMDAWHNGTRNQNVKNCSDAKLKLNYQICKDKGYDKEAAILKAEADNRGIVLESRSLVDIVNFLQESLNK